MDRAREWFFPTVAQWKDAEKTWRFPSGATISFGYLENEQDKYRYQSSEFQFIGFDELTQFSETQYTYLFSRLRRLEKSNVPLRMRATSNPGDKGHDWVKQRFIVEGQQNGRPFIPAKMSDNPYLDQVAYNSSLDKLDYVTRSQLKEGNWDVFAGGSKFKREWFGSPLDAMPDAMPSECKLVRYWDLAATEPKKGNDPDWTAGCLMGRTPAGICYIKDMRHMRGSPLAVESLIKQTAQLDGQPIDIYMEQEPGSSGVNTIDHYQREVLQRYSFHGVKTTGSKEVRANPVSAQAEAGNIRLVRGNWINDFLSEVEQFPNGAHDDQVDAMSGAYEQLTAAIESERIVVYDTVSDVEAELQI